MDISKRLQLNKEKIEHTFKIMDILGIPFDPKLSYVQIKQKIDDAKLVYMNLYNDSI